MAIFYMHGVEVVPPRKEPTPGEPLKTPELGVFPPPKPEPKPEVEPEPKK
jgi:hypothetical protein